MPSNSKSSSAKWTLPPRNRSPQTSEEGVISGSADAASESLAKGAGVARDVFVARQPIFDAQKRVHAYELLFRGGLENFCPVGDPDQAATEVLQATWLTFGLSTLLGEHKAFTNFTRDLLIGGYGETLPPEPTVIELLETIDGDPDIIEACQRLKTQGYALALDDFVYWPALEPLIPLADIVKINFRATNPAAQPAMFAGWLPQRPNSSPRWSRRRRSIGRRGSSGFASSRATSSVSHRSSRDGS